MSAYPRRRIGVPSLILALALAAAPAASQQLPGAPRAGALSASSAGLAAAGVDSARDLTAVTLAAVTATGAPRSYQVVSIPVPQAFSQALDVQVEIVPRGEFVVLGARIRTLVASPGRKNQVGVTIGVPASALAGHLVAAEARFSSVGYANVIVPIEIDVTLVRQLALRPSSVPLHGQAGKDVILRFEIENSGNARETVDTQLELPSGWASRRVWHPAIVIEPGTIVKRTARVAIPRLSNTGSSFIKVDVRTGRELVASSTITLEVFNAGSVGRHAGPQVVSAVSHATDGNGRKSKVYSLATNGALFDSVRIDARMSYASSLGVAATNTFARMGTFNSSPSVVLSAPSGQLSLGNTGASFSELTGLYPYGQGALLNLRKPGWELTSLGALSIQTESLEKREPMLGIRIERQLGELRVSSSLSHLADGGSSPRRLDAAGIGVAVPSPFGSTFKAEIAERRFDGGRGMGWSTEMFRTNSGSSEQLRVSHAPGGSDAFARATNEILANISERLSPRAMVSASAWRTTDATSVFSGLTSSGLSLRPQYEIHSAATIAIEARSYLFDAASRAAATNPGSSFGSREGQLGITLNTRIRQFYLNTSAFMGNVTRTVTPVGQAIFRDRSPRNYWTTTAGWSGIGGGLEAQTRIEQTRDRSGFVNQQNLYGIRGEQVVVPWLGGIRAEGELQRVNGFGSQKSSMMRAGVSVPLVSGFALKLDAERNSIFRMRSGRTPWVLGTRIEHSLTLPMLRAPGTGGYVFQDLNGNQRRDRDEPGVAGAMVRRGSETSIADESGKYRVGGDARQPVVVDEASLPEGWTGTGSAHNDLGVSLSTSAEVEFIVAPRSGISMADVDLAKAHVIARDAAGREWSARMSGPTTATFDALPVGVYTLVFDLSELTEPLVPRGQIPPLVVDGKKSRSLTVTLDPRPIRMWSAPGQRGTDGNGARKPKPVGADTVSGLARTPADK